MFHQDKITQLFNELEHEIVALRVGDDLHEVRAYAFPVVYNALVNAGLIPSIYSDVPGVDYRTVYAMSMYGLCQCLEVADLWLHEYSRTDVYDLTADTVTWYDGIQDAVKFGFSGVVMHDLS